MAPISRRWIAIGSLLGAIGVALGAFGAHWLPVLLERIGYAGDDLARRLEIFETAIRYQLIHAIALVLTVFALQHFDLRAWRAAAWAFLVGVVIFSGLLKVLTLADPSWNRLGAVVPVGGIAMIAGWVLLSAGALQAKN